MYRLASKEPLPPPSPHWKQLARKSIQRAQYFVVIVFTCSSETFEFDSKAGCMEIDYYRLSYASITSPTISFLSIFIAIILPLPKLSSFLPISCYVLLFIRILLPYCLASSIIIVDFIPLCKLRVCKRNLFRGLKKKYVEKKEKQKFHNSTK